MINIRVFYLKNFVFLEVKFSLYLNRQVFVMLSLLYMFIIHVYLKDDYELVVISN